MGEERHERARLPRPRRLAYAQERTAKNEFELALDGMISSWFRWYWVASALLILLGAAL